MPEINRQYRFILVNLVPLVFNREAALFDLEELKSLVDTLGGATIVRVIQRRTKPDPGTFIGSGKALEVSDLIQKEKINAVVVNNILSSSQIFNLEQIFWKVNPDIKVWDRIDLILNIFDKHAATREAKLQIELARMRHMGPRMYGLGTFFSRLGGGIGTRGKGQTNIELMKRHWRIEMKKIELQLQKLEKNRENQTLRRHELGFKTISIVGYTNAGKTSLFNAFTGKEKLALDVLFATLDSTIGKIHLPGNKEVLVSDTIGFIQNLPPHLVTAFKSTLMESIHADLLLHCIDASDVLMYEKIEVVENVLKELGIENKKKIYVFNKIDKKDHLDRQEICEIFGQYDPQFISVKTGEGLEELQHIIASKV